MLIFTLGPRFIENKSAISVMWGAVILSSVVIRSKEWSQSGPGRPGSVSQGPITGLVWANTADHNPSPGFRQVLHFHRPTSLTSPPQTLKRDAVKLNWEIQKRIAYLGWDLRLHFYGLHVSLIWTLIWFSTLWISFKSRDPWEVQ